MKRILNISKASWFTSIIVYWDVDITDVSIFAKNIFKVTRSKIKCFTDKEDNCKLIKIKFTSYRRPNF